MGSVPRPRFDVKKIAVIGAGPCGLAAAKYLKAQPSIERIVVFEQNDQVGGIWNYDDAAPGSYPAPQEDPFFPPDTPVRTPQSKSPMFLSPMYKQLHANIPGSLMKFSDQGFPKDAWLYPSREVIQDYLVKYAEDVRDLIQFCFQVKRIDLESTGGTEKWHVEARSTETDELVRERFDAVVIANGHYAIPFIPNMRNITEFQAAYPSIITHSKQFRTPDPYQSKKTIVVGNGPSGLDIAMQINKISSHRTLLSVRSATSEDKLCHTGCEEVPEIEELLIAERGVRFKGGRVETGIDAIVMCTGFLFSYPFLPSLRDNLISTGKGAHRLYQHFFSIDHPTLVFPSLNMKAIPWPVAEVQAAVFSAVWSNTLELPPLEEMERWTKELEASSPNGALHLFAPMEDGRYINEMHDWAMKATHLPKQPPRWGEEQFWLRKVYADAKVLFEKDGCKAKTMEELGLHFEPAADRR